MLLMVKMRFLESLYKAAIYQHNPERTPCSPSGDCAWHKKTGKNLPSPLCPAVAAA
jgi:hypothetical protein